MAAADPESLFGELPRTPLGVGALWSHQADQLRTYNEQHRSDPDVALELPTGSGKTLVGLLLAEWRRRTLSHRVVYACPTKQLARQVFDKARQQGIAVVLLVGSHYDWDRAALARYTRGEAVAVTSYSSIFNNNSHLADAQTLLFDDAHAAEGYVAEAWSLTVERRQSAYTQLLDALSDSIDPQFVTRMVAPDSVAADSSEVRLLPVATVANRIGEVDAVLATLQGNEAWRFRALRANLASCLFYVARSAFYIRPMIPPTFQHDPYTKPEQRIYLSATLGEAGELERSFGRSPISRVPVPSAWDRTGSGRRFFAFPELATPPASPSDATAAGEARDDSEGVTAQQSTLRQLLDLAQRRLILTPDDQSASTFAEELGVPEDQRYTPKDPEHGLQPFLTATVGTLLAANRYDGMDLADESCRMMLLAGLPSASHLQDRFLETKLRAGEVLQERIRTRVVQGAGRCTRGPKDWSVVVVAGEDLLRFFSRGEVRSALPVELQAEVAFGLEISQTAGEDLVLLGESALTQDAIWQEDAEPELAKRRREAFRSPAAHVGALASSATREIKAWALAWQQDWEAAARAAVDVMENTTDSSLRPYRALWAYLGSAWSALAAADGDPVKFQRSAELLRIAHKAATGTTWLKEVQPLSTARVDTEPADEDAVEAVTSLLDGPMRSAAKFSRESAAMLAGLAQNNHSPYEAALATLGRLLGANSFKPPGRGRADAAWLWASLWISLEAKSEQDEGGMLSMDYVRQTNTHLDSLTTDMNVDSPPEGSVSVVVTPRSVVDPDAVAIAAPQVHLASPKVILDIAHNAVRAWTALRGAAPGAEGDDWRQVAAKILWQHRVLPSQVREFLTRDPIRGR